MLQNISRRHFIKLGSAGLAGLTLGACKSITSNDIRDSIFLICMADLHSCHKNLPAISALVQQYSSQNPEAVVVLINGDVFERGNVVALRSDGVAEWTFLEQIAQLTPVIVNIGNHEGALEDDLKAVVSRMQEMGITVISNITEKNTGTQLAAVSHSKKMKNIDIQFAGIATDDRATYRQVHQDRWEFPDAIDYANQHLNALLSTGDLKIVMDHDGVLSDRAMMNKLPSGTLLLGGHDHVRFVTQTDKVLALHTGWWGNQVDIVKVELRNNHIQFDLTVVPFSPNSEKDSTLAALISSLHLQYLTPEEKEIVATNNSIFSPVETMVKSVEILSQQTATDATLMNNTTFGAALPLANVRRFDLNNTIRFDGGMMRSVVSGSQLQLIKNQSNQYSLEIWDESIGEYCIGTFPEIIQSEMTYSIAVNGWVALPFNQQRFLGVSGLSFEPVENVTSIREVVRNGIV